MAKANPELMSPENVEIQNKENLSEKGNKSFQKSYTMTNEKDLKAIERFFRFTWCNFTYRGRYVIIILFLAWIVTAFIFAGK